MRMFKNYCKTAFRNLIRNKKFSLINISGLAIGIASCILIFLVVHYELSYDRFQSSYNNIYHVATEDKFPAGIDYTPGTPYPAREALRGARARSMNVETNSWKRLPVGLPPLLLPGSAVPFQKPTAIPRADRASIPPGRSARGASAQEVAHRPSAP